MQGLRAGAPPQDPSRRGVTVTLRLAQQLSLKCAIFVNTLPDFTLTSVLYSDLVNVLHGGPRTEESITANQLINIYLMQSAESLTNVPYVAGPIVVACFVTHMYAT